MSFKPGVNSHNTGGEWGMEWERAKFISPFILNRTRESGWEEGLLDIANKNRGYPVNFEFQIINKSFFGVCLSQTTKFGMYLN